MGERRRDRPVNLGVVSRLVRKRHLVAEEFVYLRGRTSRVAKVTLPSPSLFVNFWSPERSKSAYAGLEHFLADVVAILRDEVAELVRLGATYIHRLTRLTTRCSSRAAADDDDSLAEQFRFALGGYCTNWWADHSSRPMVAQRHMKSRGIERSHSR